MADIDLRALPGSDVVLHFGGSTNEIDAYTFSNCLLEMSEAMREINNQINDNFSIEITIEGIGPGSFKARIATRFKSLGGLLAKNAKNVIISVFSSYVFLGLHPDVAEQVIVNDDSVIVVRGHDRIIIPRNGWDAKEKIKDNSSVETHIAKAFSILSEDPSVTDFAIAPSFSSKAPVGIINRDDFPSIIQNYSHLEVESANKRHKDERTKLTVLKLVFERGPRKWQFVWNGVRISAAIKSETFFHKLASHEYKFTQGDVLDVTLRIYQRRDDISGVWINTGYEVIEVHGLENMPRQSSLLR